MKQEAKVKMLRGVLQPLYIDLLAARQRGELNTAYHAHLENARRVLKETEPRTQEPSDG